MRMRFSGLDEQPGTITSASWLDGAVSALYCHVGRHKMVHLPMACGKWREGLNMRVLFGKQD